MKPYVKEAKSHFGLMTQPLKRGNARVTMANVVEAFNFLIPLLKLL